MNWSKYFCGMGLAICLALRVFLIFTNIDPVTGFYSSNSIAVSFYNTMILLILLISVGYGLFLMKPTEFQVKKPIVTSLASAVCGLTILGVSVLSFRSYLHELFRWSNPLDQLTEYPMEGVLQLLRLLIGIIAAASLLSLAISGGKLFRRSGLLLAPAIWTLIYTVNQFMAYPQIADMSDRVLWLLSLIFFAMTMLGQARIMRGVNGQKGARYVCAFGYACGFCGLLLGGSQIITLERVCTIDTMQWVLTTAMALHATAMAYSCQISEE